MKLNKKNVKLVLVLLMVMICLAIAVLALNVRRESAFLFNSDGKLKNDLKDLRLNPDIVNQVIPDVYDLDTLFDECTEYMNRFSEFIDFDKMIVALEAVKAAGVINESTPNVDEIWRLGVESSEFHKLPQTYLKNMKEWVKVNTRALPNTVVQYHVKRIETYATDVLLPKMVIFEQGLARVRPKLEDHTINSILVTHGITMTPIMRERYNAVLLPIQEFVQEWYRNMAQKFPFLAEQ